MWGPAEILCATFNLTISNKKKNSFELHKYMACSCYTCLSEDKILWHDKCIKYYPIPLLKWKTQSMGEKWEYDTLKSNFKETHQKHKAREKNEKYDALKKNFKGPHPNICFDLSTFRI